MMPPLVLWLAGYIACGWWSGHEPSGAGRAIGVGLLMTCSAIISLYLCNYVKPIRHPPALRIAHGRRYLRRSEYLSTAICPNVPGYWQAGGIPSSCSWS